MKNIIVRQHVTEKSLALAAKGYFTFVVAKFARKEEIKSAIHNLYAVHVLEARIIGMDGWKKAIVRLMPGEKIEAFEITKEEDKKEKTS